MGDIDYALRLATREPLRKWWRSVGRWWVYGAMLFGLLHLGVEALYLVLLSNGVASTQLQNLLWLVWFIPLNSVLLLLALLAGVNCMGVQAAAVERFSESGAMPNENDLKPALLRLVLLPPAAIMAALLLFGLALSVLSAWLGSEIILVHTNYPEQMPPNPSWWQLVLERLPVFQRLLATGGLTLLLCAGIALSGVRGGATAMLWCCAGTLLQTVISALLVWARMQTFSSSGMGLRRSVPDLELWVFWLLAPLLYYAVLNATRSDQTALARRFVLLFAFCTICMSSITGDVFPADKAYLVSEAAPLVNLFGTPARPLLEVPFDTDAQSDYFEHDDSPTLRPVERFVYRLNFFDLPVSPWSCYELLKFAAALLNFAYLGGLYWALRVWLGRGRRVAQQE